MNERRVEQIRRAYLSARPHNDNPAWMNCHHDCGFLLTEIERLYERIIFAESLILRLDGIHGPIFNEYAKRYPLPAPSAGESR
jgi:hypothetical protein